MLEGLVFNFPAISEAVEMTTYLQNDLHIKKGYEYLIDLGIILGTGCLAITVKEGIDSIFSRKN